MSGSERKKEAKSSAEATATAEKAVPEVPLKMIPIYVMGKRYEVPENLTIMTALEYAGYKFIRGCGCRGGICGACATVYRKPGDYKIYNGLACQTVVEPNMYLAQIPFYPANRVEYEFEKLKPAPEEIFKLYPELFRCVACNACTKICPMDIEVMDAVAAMKAGDIAKVAELTRDCIQCGLCVSRCMAELPQYHIFQLARRIHAGKMTPKADHLATAVIAIREGKYQEMLEYLMGLDEEGLKEEYKKREVEPETIGEDWRPLNKAYLLEVED